MKKFIVFFLTVVVLLMSSCQRYSQGERVGIITKFSESGAIWKSYEGELKIAPNAVNQGMIGQYETFSWSVDNDETIECVTPVDSIELYARQGIPVAVKYQQVKFLNWFQNRGNTDYFVKEVIRLKN